MAGGKAKRPIHPLDVLKECYMADTVMVAHELGCSVSEAALAQIEAAGVALPYLAGEEETLARAAIFRAEALSTGTAAPSPRR